MKPAGRYLLVIVVAFLSTLAAGNSTVSLFTVAGEVAGPDGTRIAGVSIKVADKSTTTDAKGRFSVSLPSGKYGLRFSKAGFAPLRVPVSIAADTDLKIVLQPGGAITVRPEPDVLSPDPSTRTLPSDELIGANPGHPGVPLSIPGLPAETASGGIKAPQYFAPGVAGDHGEPIAQYIGVGDFEVPNNLTANAHGNGYADPNLLIASMVGTAQVDDGAFNVREGDHAVNLAVDYALRPQLGSFIQATGDSRDGDMVWAWAPHNPATQAWVGLEAAYGEGLLARPENRKQYKINAYHGLTRGKHHITLAGIGYYGSSWVPGLVPIDVPVPGDTIDPRQSDHTHTSLAVVSDTWKRSDKDQFHFSGFFRTYSLSLLSDFGAGLIRQSEFRTVAGGNASLVLKPAKTVSVLAGVDTRRDAPRGLNLDRADAAGAFLPLTSNDLTISAVSPFASLSGKLTSRLQYNLGVRRDQFQFVNDDLITPSNSYTVSPGITSPKATVTFLPPGQKLPSIALSYGQAFYVNDPRIGLGTAPGSTPIAKSRAYQLVATEFAAGTQFSLTLAHFTNSAQLGRIDPDTGLQENLGPSLIRSLTFCVRRYYRLGFIQGSFSRADARDPLTGIPVPEAPRLIWDASGTIERLPLHLTARGEFEYVGSTPLGDGFNAMPIREVKSYLARSFDQGRWESGMNLFVAHGYTGQTLETLVLPGEAAPFERIVGVRLMSYAALSLTYHLGVPRK